MEVKAWFTPPYVKSSSVNTLVELHSAPVRTLLHPPLPLATLSVADQISLSPVWSAKAAGASWMADTARIDNAASSTTGIIPET